MIVLGVALLCVAIAVIVSIINTVYIVRASRRVRRTYKEPSP